MNSKELIDELKMLEGKRVAFAIGFESAASLNVTEVMPLPPDQRLNNSGNVIIHNGVRDKNGNPEGVTLWARDVADVVWVDDVTCLLYNKYGNTICLLIVKSLGETYNEV